jgi:FemAB-related protein (PEP-CTERM system-associated)
MSKEQSEMDFFLRSGKITVAFCDTPREQDWTAYVDNSSHTVFGHHLAWKSVIEETFGHQTFYLMAYRRETVVGILPLCLIKSRLFGRFLVTSPYLTFGGVATEDEDAATALISSATQIAREQQVDYLELRNDRPHKGLPHTKSTYYNLVLDLSPGEEEIWNSHLLASARRNVKKARRLGLYVSEGCDHVDTYSMINAKNMHRLGTPHHGRGFFSNILKNFPESTLLLMACLDDTPVAGMLLVKYKDTVLMPWVASLPNYLHMRPNNLLYWEAIVRACRDGFSFFDFGRSKWDSGTFRFKAQHGAQPVQLYYQFFLMKSKKVPAVEPESKAFKPLISIWRNLPFPVVNMIGPHLIRGIP